jgi:hypothetical protein
MSALPQKADTVRNEHDVRFVPKADMPGLDRAICNLARS